MILERNPMQNPISKKKTMKFSLIAIVLIGLLGFAMRLTESNPYFDPEKLHHTKTGFRNPFLNLENQEKSFKDLFRMMSESRPKYHFKTTEELNLLDLNQKIESGVNFVTWVGHSTMLVNIGGKTILTDPIFSGRCSPVQFAGPKRYTKPSIDIDSLPKIDLIIISHNHYDHLDKNSVKILSMDTSTVWYVPLGLQAWFKKHKVHNVKELDWYDSQSFDNVNIVCLPSQHWSKRNLFRSFDTLWASWSIEVGNYKLWFAGDTGYNSIQFKEIGESYGPFDLAMIPIGAYEPRWFMKNFHINPRESILVHKDVKSKKSIGMHFGTFILTTEPINEPAKELIKNMSHGEIRDDSFIIPKLGKIYLL